MTLAINAIDNQQVIMYVTPAKGHVRMLPWLDPSHTNEIAMSKGKETLAKREDLWPMPTA